MNKVTKSSITSLMEPPATQVLTLYIPTHRYPTPPHMQEDQTRFKNMIRAGRDAWKEQTNEQAAEAVYQQLAAKLDEHEFWQDMTEGMAIFASPDEVQIFHLPIECEERVFVGNYYDTTPLLMLRSYDQPYYVLALSMHNTSLYKGDMYGLEPVTLDFPASPEDALNIDEMFSNSQTTRAPQGAGAASPHGQGDSQGAGSEERLQYFRIIDRLMTESDSVDHSQPFVIAGTENEVGDYKQVTKLPAVVDTFLQGNHEETQLQDLYAEAWPVIRQEVSRPQTDQLLETYGDFIGSGKASSDITSIGEAAQEGRVDTLLLGMIHLTADSVSDTPKSDIPIISFSQEYDSTHITQIAHNVAMHGGQVIGIETDAMPEQVFAAALYRY